MKTRIAALALLAAASSTFADQPVYVPSDESPLSRLCVAALESPAALRQLASELDVKPGITTELACNGMPVADFVRRARQARAQALRSEGEKQDKAVLFAFRRGDNSLETQLCLSALTSPLRFESLKRQLGEEGAEKEVLCNDQPLEQFVRRYRNSMLNASL